MIGYYDYTVILTYFSLLSAVTGIVVSLSGGGHPYYGCFFLLFCGSLLRLLLPAVLRLLRRL